MELPRKLATQARAIRVAEDRARKWRAGRGCLRGRRAWSSLAGGSWLLLGVHNTGPMEPGIPGVGDGTGCSCDNPLTSGLGSVDSNVASSCLDVDWRGGNPGSRA